MKRRVLLRAFAGVFACAPRLALAEPRRLGWLGTSTRDAQQPIIDVVMGRLDVRGWRLGRDIALVARFGNNRLEALPGAARELVALTPSAIISVGSPSSAAASRETRTIPIVMVYASTPVEVGLVQSLARPGGNVTGTTGSPPEVAGKLLEVLRVAQPTVARVAILRNPDNLGIRTYTQYSEATARRLDMTLKYFELRKAADLRLDDVAGFRPDALYIINDFVLIPLYETLLAFAREHRLLTIGVSRQFTEAGGLLSLGPDTDEMNDNVADYVDRVLRGASPATLPVREPSRYHIFVNRAAARAIGLPLSQELLLRTREVIE
ncbi:MAG: ABC transporter substrate-binding protein [Burkholderiales bacterium]|nr:ABC transporter substrate-binding protein [Burkholderiales bacterium]